MVNSEFLSHFVPLLPYVVPPDLGAGGGGLVGRIMADRSMERARSRNDEKLAVLRNEYETANRKLQAQLDRASGVHQLRVEKEFKALSGIWEKVVETGRVMAGLRPFLDIASDEEDALGGCPRAVAAAISSIRQGGV